MSTFRFPDYTWLADSTHFGQFLDLAFANDSGEVWLYNNDLRMILDRAPFKALYLDRVCGTLRQNIRAVKILLRPDIASPKLTQANLTTFLLENEPLRARLSEMAEQAGPDRLSAFYFGVADATIFPAASRGASDGSWIFYARAGELHSGVAMFRPRTFPFFLANDRRKFAVTWLLEQQPALTEALQGVFDECFSTATQFVQLRVQDSASATFTLVPAPTFRAGPVQPASMSVSLGDIVDVAVLTALPEETHQVRSALQDAGVTVGRVPVQRPRCHYAIVQARSGPKRVLLAATGDQGSLASAALTLDIINQWQPRNILLAGVAGGDPHDDNHRIGDVLLGKWIVGYERGKLTNGTFENEYSTYDADTELLAIATEIKHDDGWQPRIPQPRPADARDRFHVHDDVAIASGAKLIADAAQFATIAGVRRKIQGVEMEAEGVAFACRYVRDHNTPLLVVKGIMDKANFGTRDEIATSTKDVNKVYAARISAEYVLEIIRRL